MKCRECGSETLEKRGERRCYAELTPSGEVDGWSEGDDIEWDTDALGRELIYCDECDAEQVLVDGELVALAIGEEPDSFFLDGPAGRVVVTRAPSDHERGYESGYSAAIHDARVPGSRAHAELKIGA